MKLLKLFLSLILFTQACQAQLSKNEAEKMIIGVWQAVPYPKPPQGRASDALYEEAMWAMSPIVNFTKDYQYIDSLSLEMYGENSSEFEKMQWEVSEDAKYLFFNGKKSQTSTKFLIHKLDKDTFWLKYEAKNENILFLKKIQRYESDGLPILLPPKRSKEELDVLKLKERNVFKILINSSNQLLVEDEPMRLKDLRKAVKDFIDNRGRNKESSENPQEAVISYKSDRGTRYSTYVRVLDEIKAAYHELRAKALGISLDDYLQFDEEKARKDEKFIQKVKIFCQEIKEEFSQKMIKKYLDFDIKAKNDDAELKAYQKARKSSPDIFLEKYYDAQRQFPMRITEAEPTKIGG
jgi:biopolymer transport protein ExbD